MTAGIDDRHTSDPGSDESNLNNRPTTGGEVEGREGDHGIERILVALDPSTHSGAALEAGARMASRLGAELIGLFVEDVNVRRLAELPFVQEVGFFTGRCRRVETRELSRQLQVQAGRVQTRFRVRTQRLATRCTFRVVRGRVAPEVLAAAAEADVVIMGKGAWSPFETEHLAPAVREVLTKTPASTLVLRAGAEIEPPMRVVYDGTSLADKAVATAAELTKDDDGHVMIFLVGEDPDEASCMEQKVTERWEDQGIELSFHRLTKGSVSRLAHLVAHEEGGTLVLPAGEEALEDEAVLSFLDVTRVPVLLVR